jgi:DNA-binding NarL/FixJ family response regulator
MIRNTQSPVPLSTRRPPVAARSNLRLVPAAAAAATARRPAELLRTTPEPMTLARAVAEVRAALEEAAFATAQAAARASAVAEALASLSVGERSPAPLRSPSTPRAFAALSPREREVLALVAAGQTNKAIAEALYVSPNTVKTHVSSLLQKLHAETRVQLAAIATRNGLS